LGREVRPRADASRRLRCSPRASRACDERLAAAGLAREVFEAGDPADVVAYAVAVAAVANEAEVAGIALGMVQEQQDAIGQLEEHVALELLVLDLAPQPAPY
jgi:hypothetical protein